MAQPNPRGPHLSPADAVRAELIRLKASRRARDVSDFKPMLPEWREQAFTDANWTFELKYDGFRLFAARDPGKARLIYRRGLDATHVFPDVVTALKALPYTHVVFDGEVGVLDANGRPSFQRLQQRTQLTRPSDLRSAAVSLPATLFLFDLLAFEDFDLSTLPLHVRKTLLHQLLPTVGVLRAVEDFPEQGERLYQAATQLGFEGIVGKRLDSPYTAGRSASWIKVRREHISDFVIVGFTAPSGNREGLGAVHLGAYRGDALIYTGRAGTGFTHAQLLALRKDLEADRQPRPPFTGPPPEGKGHHWVHPRRVCEVRFHEWTRDGRLRMPVFQRFRPDKTPKECALERASAEPASEPASEPALSPKGPSATERKVALTHPGKMYWPADGITKGDMVEYYRAVSPWLLPYLNDRPLVMTRFPDGIEGKSFFQKDAPAFAPSWLRLQRLWSEDTQREIGYILCDNVESLLYVANSASIPLHIWASRVAQLQQPDWTILDFDPKGAPFADVVTLARSARRLCDALELPSHPKTTGGTGLHVLIPLGGQCTFEEARSLAELLARVLVTEHPNIATVVRDTRAREGKVYVDYLQNGYGKLLVSPYSVRPFPLAPVSMPIEWSEVGPKLMPRQFTIQNAIARLRRKKEDPLRGVLTEKPNLARALGKLSERLEKEAR